MRFFARQVEATRSGRRLVARMLFAVTVAAVAAGGAVALAFEFLSLSAGALGAGHATAGGLAALSVIGLALVGMLRQRRRLRAGGAALARILGARAVGPGSSDPRERCLSDVAREAATAAGVQVPALAVLEGDDRINASALGYGPADATMIFTRGALEALSREELQVVFAHALAQVLHGDVRPALQLSVFAGGLQEVFETGRHLLAERHAAPPAEAIAPVSRLRRWARATVRSSVGVLMLAAGAPGWLAGRWLQAGAAHSRALRADATAIRLARMPDALGSTLQKTQRQHPESGIWPSSQTRRGLAHRRGGRALVSMTAHSWFVAPERRGRWFTTHPPIAERIGRVASRVLMPNAPAHGRPVSDAWPLRWHVAAAAVRRPAEARTVALALLAPGRAASLRIPGAREPFAISPETLPSAARQALLELAVATLRHETSHARADLLREARRLVETDARVTLLEFVFYLTVIERVRERDAHDRVAGAWRGERLIRSAGRRLTCWQRGSRLPAEHAEASAALALLVRAALDWQRSRAPRSLRSLARAFERAGAYWGWQLWSPPGALDARELIAAIHLVGALSTLERARAIKALAAALLGDCNMHTEIRATQAAVLRALCFAWGVPLPPARGRAVKRDAGEVFAASPTLVYLDA